MARVSHNLKQLPRIGQHWFPWLGVLGAVFVSLLGRQVFGLSPDSDEVKKMVHSGLAYLETRNDDRLGGKCLVALAFIKAGRGDHPRVAQAIEACYQESRAARPEAELDVYSNGLAVILLCEWAPEKYAQLIEWYLDRLKQRQKEHGGWGYTTWPTGDTSQSQYGALAYWEANRNGFPLDAGSINRFADWLVRTQGPEGEWGYQGNVSTESPVQQNEVTCSMLAAGLGSTYICAELFGMRPKADVAESKETSRDDPPPALKRVIQSGRSAPRQYRPQIVNSTKISHTIARAHSWMRGNYTIDQGLKTHYYLYGLERYKSFQEEFENKKEESPQWYNDGVAYLATKQRPDGSWLGFCGAECDTAFSILFLLRSTQKSIEARLGEGMLLAGRGLPNNLARAKLRNGQLVVEQVHTKVGQLLTMIEDSNDAELDDLARDPSQLVIDSVDDKSARRLQQLVRGGEPEVRLLAVRTLGRTGNLDCVPTLIYALTDPDRRVVLEARNELRFISRSFDGFGPPDDFDEKKRYEAVDAWKKWYLSIRPDAILEQP